MDPKTLRYTEDHEWISQPVNGVCTVGLSDHAQQELGDIVFVELPEAPQEVEEGDSACTVESVKAASDVYSPVSGVIQKVNEALEDEPAKINQDPYGEGWLYTIRPEDVSDLEKLMDFDAYQKFLNQ